VLSRKRWQLWGDPSSRRCISYIYFFLVVCISYILIIVDCIPNAMHSNCIFFQTLSSDHVVAHEGSTTLLKSKLRYFCMSIGCREISCGNLNRSLTLSDWCISTTSKHIRKVVALQIQLCAAS
jgi:hypothetical protein